MTTPLELGFRSKADLVTDYLRAELQAGRPGPGKRLVVNQVAERLGVSKVPVREAVTRLVGEGLLILRPNVGPIVPDFTAHEVRETAIMRVALESAAMPSAVENHTDETLASIKATLEMMTSADANFPGLNVEFHTQVIDPTPYRELFQSAQALLARAQRFSFVHTIPESRPETHAEHYAIYDALRARDLPLLQRLNEQHVLGAANQLAALMETVSGSNSPS